jgi:hypothetical protein
MVIPILGLQEVSERKFDTTQLKSTKILTEHSSNQTNRQAILLPWYILHTYILAELPRMDQKITRCVRYRSATKTAQDFANKEIRCVGIHKEGLQGRTHLVKEKN